jgi:starvation-inducible DNA-binding protein
MKLHEKMNEYLANQQVMFIKLHNLHWYIRGCAFFTLHGKLEELMMQQRQLLMR